MRLPTSGLQKKGGNLTMSRPHSIMLASIAPGLGAAHVLQQLHDIAFGAFAFESRRCGGSRAAAAGGASMLSAEVLEHMNAPGLQTLSMTWTELKEISWTSMFSKTA